MNALEIGVTSLQMRKDCIGTNQRLTPTWQCISLSWSFAPCTLQEGDGDFVLAGGRPHTLRGGGLSVVGGDHAVWGPCERERETLWEGDLGPCSCDTLRELPLAEPGGRPCGRDAL